MAGKKRSEQAEIPGTERKVNAKIKKKAEELYDGRAERMELSEQEGQLAAELIGLMKAEAMDVYVEGDMVVSIVAADERVKNKKNATGD
jgi:hypothetical protein